MPPLRSRSSAHSAESGAARPVLAPPWLIGVLSAAVCGALWLLYPRQDIERRLVSAGETELSSNYLLNLLRSDPDNPHLRLLLAQHQIARDDTVGAHATLKPALDSPDPTLRKEALWTQGELLYREYQDTPETNTPRRVALVGALRQSIHRLAQESWPIERQSRLAVLASEFDAPEIVLKITRDEAPKDTREAAQYYENSAKQALGQGDYEGCAQLYLEARKSTPDAGEAKRYYGAAVAALRSGNKPKAALELAERELGPLANDPQTLTLLIELARAAGRPDVAERYVRRLLHVSLERHWKAIQQASAIQDFMLRPVAWHPKPVPRPESSEFDDGASLLMHPARRLMLAVADNAPPAPDLPTLPFDDKTYTLGYQVFLENRKLEDAWAVASAAVRQNPGDMVWRERLAQVSEWTQRPGVALENWLQVARATQSKTAWQGVQRLASAPLDDAAVMQTLRDWLRDEPGNMRVRRLLMQRQILHGDVAGASATLKPMLESPDPAMRQQAQQTQAELLQDEYAALLGKRKLQDAWKLANDAVRKNPSDMMWRERLAQVSEWTERPGIALQNWLEIARATQKEAAWQAVLRLAPGLFDDAALVQALRHQLQSRPDDLKLIRELVDAQERLGEPQPALDYLRQHARSPAAMVLQAQLAERAGQSELALHTWRKLLADPSQLTAELAMLAAVLALTQGQPEQGLQWLQAVQDKTSTSPAAASDLWRMTGELAENRDHNALAIAAYGKLVATPDAEVGDFDALIRLLRPKQPLEAARVALLAWQRLDHERHLIEALTLFSTHKQWHEFARALALADPAPDAARHSLVALRRSPLFLRLVGAYYHETGRLAQARQYYEEALRIDPQSSDSRDALLWLLIDSNDASAIRQLLALHEQAWSGSDELHEVLAAAYQALSLPQVALDRYLTPHRAEHENDFLWLMNYADALEENQEADRAWRLRRQLLLQQGQPERQGSGAKPLTRAQARQKWLTEEGLDATRRVARARLLMQQQPGDPARDVLRELMRMDRDTKGDYSDAAAELAISWFQDAGQYNAERGFLWQQYARSRATRANGPLWAEIGAALGQEDKATAGQLLEKYDERLPRYDRINAASGADDVRLAQSAAFNAQLDQPNDDPLHQQLTENLLSFGNHAGTKVQHTYLGAASENQTDVGLHFALNPRVSLDFQWSTIRRHVTAPDLLASAPNENIASILLKWRHRDGLTQLRAASRRGYANTTPVWVEHEQRLNSSFSVRGELGWRLPSEESLALRLGGMKTRAAAHLRFQPTRQDQFVLSQWAERYRVQTGAEVGRGRHTAIEYTHALRQETPTWEVGAFWSSHRFERRYPFYLGGQGARFQQRFVPADGGDMGIDYFLPGNFRFYGVRLSTNMAYEQDYTRAIRPYASVSRTWHSELGAGYDLRLGVAGTVLGADHLSFTWGIAKSGIQSLGFTRNVQLTYQLRF